MGRTRFWWCQQCIHVCIHTHTWSMCMCTYAWSMFMCVCLVSWKGMLCYMPFVLYVKRNLKMKVDVAQQPTEPERKSLQRPVGNCLPSQTVSWCSNHRGQNPVHSTDTFCTHSPSTTPLIPAPSCLLKSVVAEITKALREYFQPWGQMPQKNSRFTKG